MKELKYLLSLSGKHRIKLIFSAIFSIIGTTLSAVPYLLVYQIVLELFKTNIDYLKTKFCVFIAIFFVNVLNVYVILSRLIKLYYYLHAYFYLKFTLK